MEKKTSPIRDELVELVASRKNTDTALTNSMLARKLGYSPGVISQYLHEDGNKYPGDVALLERKVDDFIRNEQRRKASGVETTDSDISRELNNGLEYTRKTNDIGAIIADSGDGKSRGIDLYMQRNPTAILHRTRIWSNDIAAVTSVFFEASDRGAYDHHTKRMTWACKKLVGSDRLFIFDDAHKLSRQSLQLVCDFHDETLCPIGLIGTEELLAKLKDDAQRFSRVGLHFPITSGNPRHLIEHIVRSLAPDANGEFKELCDLAQQVAEKHGHFRSAHKQLKLASEIRASRKVDWVKAFRSAHTMLLRDYKLEVA